jgi:hypothetical protein
MTPPTNRRLPMSCEPCRARKIRCPPSQSGPCGSCVKRGIPPSKCVYLRHPYHQQEQNGHSRQAQTDPQGQAASNEQLLNRIQDLENLLHSHMRAFSSPSQQPITPETDVYNAPSVSSQLSPTFQQQSLPPMVGTLHVSTSGYIRYEPRAAQWSTVFEDSPAAAMSRNLESDYATSNCFPCELTTSTSKCDLLNLLPPTTQCTELKTAFFDCFAPVSPTLPYHPRFPVIPSLLPVKYAILRY